MAFFDMKKWMTKVTQTLSTLQTGVSYARPVKVTVSSVSFLSVLINNSNITASHEVIHYVLSNPAAQTGDWTVTTANGSVTIAGSISGTTNITLYLAVPRT